MRSFSQLWPTLKRLLAYGSPWRKPLGIAVLMMWVAAAAEVSGPLLISYFIDNMVAKNNLPLKVVAGLAAAYVGLQLFAAGLHYAQSLLFNRAAVGVVQQLRTDVMDAALRQPLSEFDTQPVGQVISRVTNDTEVIRDLYVTVVATVLRSAALVGAMLVAMFSLDWRMALVAIMIFPVVLVVMVIYQRYSTPIVRRVRAYLADINDGFNEIINGMSVIQQFRQQARFGERMGEASRSHYMARMQTLRLDGFLLRPLLSLFSSLILCGLLMLFGFSASGTIEVGVLYAFISYLGRLNEPLIELTTQQAMLQQAVVAGERVFELMDGPRQQYGNDDRPLQSGTIEVDNVSFAYRDNNLVLKNINLSVPSRNFVALVGHTGSGKSTLASLLMGYYPLTEGEIRLDGRPLSSLSHSALRQGVAMVQQDPVVLADTFLANVTLGRDISEERVWQALETVQLAELARSMSDGIYTPLGEQGMFCISSGRPFIEKLKRAAAGASAIIAWGTCASWGCVQAARPNPTQATPIDKVITDKPIIKVPGCPPIPDVMSAIITYMVTFDRLPDVDRMGRPLMFYGQRIHDKCYRRAHFDAGEFVQSWDDDAARKGYCLYKMGCKGPTTYNACSSTRWNDGVSFPIQSGHGCLGCAENGFWDRGSFYSRVVDIPQMGTHSTADTVGLTALGVVAAAVGVHAVASAVDQRRRHNQQPTETEHQPGNEDKQA